jgi:hypothetical protein
MAWTSPKTWSFGEVLTSTDMNTYVRDNTEFLFDGLPAGIGSNVVQAVKTDTFTTASASYVLVTGLSVSITPSTATSKVLVIVSVFASNTSTANNSLFRLYRDATSINEGASGYTAYVRETNANHLTHWGAVFLDSPASASATTYSVEARASDGTVTVNRRGGDTEGAGVSSITLIEVAA